VNIVDPVLFQCRQSPAAPAICAPGTMLNVVSYGRLERFIHNIGHRALAHGLKRGDVVAVFMADPIFHAAMVLGLTALGIVTLTGRSVQLPTEFAVDAVISDGLQRFASGHRVINADASWLAGDGVPVPPPIATPDDPCRIVLTSGTTGNAKGILLTHRMVHQRLALHQYAFGAVLPAGTRIFCDLGLTTSLGFMFLMHALHRGGTLFLRGTDAGATMQAFGLYQVQAMVASPGGLAEFLGYYEHTPNFSWTFDVVVSGGSLLSHELARRVRARMCSNLVSAYGSTEAGIVASAPASVVAVTEGAVGYPLPGVVVEAAGQNDEGLPAGQQGTIRIRTENAASGYHGSAGASAFRNGWFYPGDLGTVMPDGLLVVGGRETAILNLGGEKINPERIEQVLASCPGVVEAGAFGAVNALGVEEVHAAIVASGVFDETAARNHCARSLPIECVPARFFQLAALPRTGMGKLDRGRLRAVMTP
jgi:acyl-CoA synthetase (AMP-forming)/AMP-acid ligase II